MEVFKINSENAIQAESVLLLLLRYVPTQDLIKLRSVNKLWNRLNQNVLKNISNFQMKMAISPLYSLEPSPLFNLISSQNQFLTNPSGLEISLCYSSTQPMSRLKDLFEISKILSVRKQIKSLHLGSNNYEPDIDDVFKILKHHANTLETLELHFRSHQNDFPVKNKEFILNSLKTLKLIGDCERKITQAILDCAPNLQSIDADVDCIDECYPLISMLNRRGFLGKLQALRVRNYISKEELLVLRRDFQGELTLTDLEIVEQYFSNGEEEFSRELENFIWRQSGKLKRLVLPAGVRVFLKQLPELEELDFGHQNLSSRNVPCCQNLVFGRDLPKLRMLNIDTERFSEEWEHCLSYDDNIGTVCNSLKELNLNVNNTDLECCRYLRNFFPSIKKLALTNPPRPFAKQLWATGWTNLSQLSLQFNNVWHTKDLFLFGITEDYKSTFKADAKERDSDWWSNITPPKRTRPTLANLTGLRKLRIICPYEEKKMSMSDFSVYFGLVELNNLGHLCIYTSQISNAAIQYLKKSLPYLVDTDIKT